MGAIIGTWTAWLLSLGGTIALIVGLAPQELRAEQSDNSPTEKPALEVVGEVATGETRLSVQRIVTAVQTAGFS
ncbi:MAG: hypothetical protein JRE71_18920 [Deltaproteobacteria bacterium]|nr:hypothetical protein [Deltaproteobacteria bacterium]